MDQKKFIIFSKTIFLCWLLFIFLVSIYPGNLIKLVLTGDPSTYPGGDKVSHFLTYFILGLFFYLSFKNDRSFKIIAIFLIFFSLLMEIIHLGIPNRFYENFDLLMNFLGLILGMYISRIYRLFSRS
jgi:VanZ family protein